MSDVLIEIRALCKSYQRGSMTIEPLRDLHLGIKAGEFLALVGPSGSGKTTLLNILAGIDRADSGSVRFEGADLQALTESELGRWRRDHVGYVFQSYNLLPVLTTWENVELPLMLRSLHRDRRIQQVSAALEAVGISELANQYPHQLSGGQEQRVAIARALATDPELILADEPTGDLDAQAAAEVLSLLSELNRDWGKTIVMATHDPRALHYAKSVSALDKGVLSDLAPHRQTASAPMGGLP